MNLNTLNRTEAAIAVIAIGLALGVALKLLDVLRPTASVLGL